MIDIHSHVINEIDDGARSIEESITILKKMSEIGFTHIIATPHYISGSDYTCNNYEKYYRLIKLNERMKQQNFPLHLYLGNENFIEPYLLSLLKKNEITTLNGSHYLLVEFPVARPMNDLKEILFFIRSKGYIPIIAHPERYSYFQENPLQLLDYLKMGCLFQGNFSNIVEKYGTKAKKLFIYMLKNNQYHFLASDVHHDNDILFEEMKKIKKSILKIISEEHFYELTYENPLKVLKDEHIKVRIGED